MAQSTSAPCPGLTAPRRLFGVETEYGFVALGGDGRRLDPSASIDGLMREAKRLVAHLPCSGDYDVFTANGSRLYVDCGLHPEIATTECTTPEEAVLYTRAGDRLLAEAARALEHARRDERVQVIVWKANVDHYSGATWGSHESYLHEAPQSVFAEQLLTHLVTRTVYSGAGGFNNRSRELQFVVSPRAFHLEHTISGCSTRARGIFHTRDEPLARRPYRRLHLLAGESLWSQTADYLRIATTALLVALIDAGRRPAAGLALASPLEALRTVATDVGCAEPLRLRRGLRRRLSAIAIQRRLLEQVEAELGGDLLPSWAAGACARWRAVLDALESSPESLLGVLDWPTKLALLRQQSESLGAPWPGDPAPAAAGNPRGLDAITRGKLLEMDTGFNRLDDRGIFASMDAAHALGHRLVTAAAIDRAVREPPAAGRGRLRGEAVTRFAAQGRDVRCSWQRIIDRGQRLALSLEDPFASESGPWQALPELRRRRPAPR